MSDVYPCISQDTWFEILKELPVKTLGKCRCVCRSWNSLIVSPSFMAAHLKHYTQNDANSLFLYKEISKCSKPGQYEQCVIFRDSSQFKKGNSLHTSICPFMLPYSSWPCFHLVGSIHGLLCLSDNVSLAIKSRVFLWNPLLDKSIKLPESSSTVACWSSSLGFGYDGRKNDHRVVKISYLHGQDGLKTVLTPLVEIYSVQERKWRVISSDYLSHNGFYEVSSSNCFVNGVICWLTRNCVNCPYNDKWVLLFNVTNETFGKMKLPQAILEERPGDFGIFEYERKVTVSYYECNYQDSSASCQIWIKEEYNVDNSWRKILNVSLYDCYPVDPVHPVNYLGRDEELFGLAKKSTKELVSYNPKTTQTEGLGLCISDSTAFCAYSESLVFLDQ